MAIKRSVPGDRWKAWAVHAYTASGAVWGFAAAQAVLAGDVRAAFLWLFVAVFVDGTDGFFARAARVKDRLPHFSGARLDDIVDYLTFVFVPALMIAQFDIVPAAGVVPVAAAMLLSSAYGFVSEDAKTDDQFFTGFPSYWNIVVLYLVVLELPPGYNAAILVALAALVFVRIGYVYPSRTPTLRVFTLTLTAVWGAMLLATILQLPDHARTLALVSLTFPAYYTVLSLVLQSRRVPPQRVR